MTILFKSILASAKIVTNLSKTYSVCFAISPFPTTSPFSFFAIWPVTKSNSESPTSIFTPFEFLSIKKDYVSPATIKIERLLYAGPLGQSNSLKIEVDFLQNVILPSKEIDYKNEYGVNAKVKVMDIREITAEKIRAMSDRIKYRDFYDFSMIMQEIKPNLLEVLDLVKQKEVRRSISFENILSNWKLAKDDKINELQSIYYSKELSDAEIEVFLKALRSKFSKPIYKS